MTEILVPAQELQRRTIRRSDWVSCNSAFIDCRTPGSDQKSNYAFIGSGVSQNADQFINLEEPHGFNLGRGRDAQRHHQQPAPALHRRGVHQLRRHIPGALGGRREAGGVRLRRRRRDLGAHLDLPRVHQRGSRRRHPADGAGPGRHRGDHLGSVGARAGRVVRSASDRRQPVDRHRRRRRRAAGRAVDQADAAALHRRADHLHAGRAARTGDPARRPASIASGRSCAPACRAATRSSVWVSATA